MPDVEEEEGGSLLVVTAQLLAYLLVFAVPAAILWLVLPDYRAIVIQLAAYLVFAVSAISAGAGWHHPSYTVTIRSFTWFVFLAVIFTAPTIAYMDGDIEEFGDFAVWVAERAGFVLAPFFLGRLLYWMVGRRSRNEFYEGSGSTSR